MTSCQANRAIDGRHAEVEEGETAGWIWGQNRRHRALERYAFYSQADGEDRLRGYMEGCERRLAQYVASK